MGNFIKSTIKTLRSEDISLLDKKKTLDGKYLESFEIIEECFTMSNISVKERGECMDETLDMLIHAQNNSIPVESVIGTKEKPFCKELIHARGNMEIILRVCKELAKIPIFAFIAVLVYVLMNSMDISIEEGIDRQIAMLDLFAPIIGISFVVNIIRFLLIKKNGINSEVVERINKYLALIQIVVSVLSYTLLEETVAPDSYATTFYRCLFMAIFSVILVVVIMIFVSLGGFEIIYRDKNEADIHRRNYELMLRGFSKQFIKKNSKLKKKNLPPMKVKEYANEILGEIEITNTFLPVVLIVFIIELFFLGFLMLGLGIKWYLFVAALFSGAAIAVCVGFMVTRIARKNMLERIIDGQLVPGGYIDYIVSATSCNDESNINNETNNSNKGSIDTENNVSNESDNEKNEGC